MDKEQILKWIKIIGGVALLALAGPMLWAALSGAVAAVSLGILFVFVWQLWPVFVETMANLSVFARMLQAKYMSIPNLTRIYNKRQKRIDQSEETLRKQAGALEVFKANTRERCRKYPERAQELQRQVDNMQRLYELKIRRILEAKAAQVRFREVLDEATDLYEAAKEAAKLNKDLGFNEEQAMDDIMIRTSLNSVVSDYGYAMADMDLALAADSHETMKSIRDMNSVEQQKYLSQSIPSLQPTLLVKEVSHADLG